MNKQTETVPEEYREALSFTGKYPPNDAEYIDRSHHYGVDFLYYRDKDGQYYYKSKRREG